MLVSAADSSVVEDRPSDSEKIAHETPTDTNAPTQWGQIAILLALYLVMFAVALVQFYVSMLQSRQLRKCKANVLML